MADALVSALVGTIMGNINSLSIAEMGIAGDLSYELRKLESSFSAIQAVLEDAEQKQRKDKAIKDWLRKLKAVGYDIENTLEEFKTEALARRLRPNLSNQVSRFFSLSNPLFLRIRMAHRLKALREKLDSIADEKHQFHVAELGNTEASEREWRKTSSLVIESEILGRDEEKESMVGVLINKVRDNDETSVVSICGMGGLGKTTLAQLVYNDERVVGAFDLRCWVCVSDDFDITRLTRAILESIEGISCNIQELDPLQRRLVEKLMGKRFLLVLDDVWNESESQWDRLKEVFRYGARGSAVVVTTRIEKIALMMSTEPVHHEGYLSEVASWNLFKRHAFESSDCGDCVHLEVTGKEIVKKCGGVPLAIKVLGSLLRYKKQETEWLSVKESEIWNLEDKNSKLLCEILRLSYDNLSPHLRQCFAFCALFPKDHVMRKEQLIQLWMADGFIPSIAHMDLNDLGCEIFNELTQRSFFMDVGEKFVGEIHCKMHDLMHDLALSIVRDECFTISGSYPEEFQVPNNVHHLCTTNPDLVHRASKIQSLRSLLAVLGGYTYCREISFSRSRNRFLRTLVLPRFNLRNYSVLHGCKQLRHLDLSWSSIKVLPNSVSCLHNLQTINLRYCRELEKLPKDMNHMKELVYLDITDCDRLVCLPVSMGKLVRLRKLSIFIVGKENGYGIDELQELDLGGELCIKQLGNVKDIREARRANLMRKQNLRSLTLIWEEGTSRNIVPDETAEDVLDGLQPHPNLKELIIRVFPGGRLPFWIMESLLPNLVQISLDCGRSEKLPPLGELRFLKDLRMVMDSVEFIGSDFYGDCENSFPSLEDLTIRARVLKEWKTIEGRENFARLHKLDIGFCRQLSEVPILPSLKDLHVIGLEALPEGLGDLTSLRVLELSMCDSLVSVPENAFGSLSSLSSLTITYCEKLSSLPDSCQYLTALEDLSFIKCPELTSLPDSIGCLTALQRLTIRNCKRLTTLPNDVSQLTSLSTLDISVCPELTSFPDSIGCLTTLQRLSINYCTGLTALPNDISQLTSLSELHIFYCPNLRCLPEGLQDLTTLSRLWIQGCPLLERRCEKEMGADWPKIAHIDEVMIRKE